MLLSLDDATGVATAEQSLQIEVFLAEPAIVAMLRLAFLADLAPRDERRWFDEVANQEAFCFRAEEWCLARGQTWHGLAPVLWARLRDQQRNLLDRVDVAEAPPDPNGALLDRFLFGPLTKATMPEYLRVLGRIIVDGDRQDEVGAFISAARSLDTLRRSGFQVQGLAELEAQFADLYIDRNLMDARTGRSESASSQLDVWASNPRIVVVGDPGVGKSTLMSWLRWRIRSATSTPHPPIPLTVSCRHQLKERGTTLLSAIKSQIEEEYQASPSDVLIQDLLTTGWLMLIVDGVDEILDQTQRRSVVEQLDAFTYRYPFCSIVATTRRTGFEVSLFATTNFRVLSLGEYTEEQVAEYARKWFATLPDAEVKFERFLGESRTLQELRRNPLMLALLCQLFRQYDFIPRSRREVYLRCAALMFHEWDPRRGIAIPNLFKNEGEAILREVALLLQDIGGVGASVEERQLVSLISTRLKGRGEDPVAADAMARELLEYCAGRAWILTRTGRVRGAEHYAFTHRTFFEFFAAEGIVRRLNRTNELQQNESRSGSGMGSVSRAIREIFVSDPTSVMPELLVQAADDLMDGVGTVVIQQLLRNAPATGTDTEALISLAVRLVAAAGVNPDVADQVFDAMLAQWSRPVAPSMETFTPLLDVAAGHRARLIERLTAYPPQGGAFLRRYARLHYLGEAGLFSDQWRDGAIEIASRLSWTKDADPAAVYFAAEAKAIDLDLAVQSLRGEQLLGLCAGKIRRQGLIWRTISSAAESQKRRERAWKYATKAIVSSDAVTAEPSPRYLNYLHDCKPASTGNVIPADLVVCLALLVGSEGDDALSAKTGREDAVRCARAVRMTRTSAVAERKELLGRGGQVPDRASQRDKLRRLYMHAFNARCPRWLEEYALVADGEPTFLAWSEGSPDSAEELASARADRPSEWPSAQIVLGAQ